MGVVLGAVNIDWDSYEPYDRGNAGPLRSLPRAEARRAFQRCMETKPLRLAMLDRLLESNGIELSSTDAAIQDLNDWFFVNVDADPEQSGLLRPLWYSVIHDIALFLGDVMIERHPNLHWEFFTWGKTNVAFQKHVIMGLNTEDPKFHTNIDIDRTLATYAHRIIEARGSIPCYGTVEIRGTPVDIDAIASRHRPKEIDREAFLHWLQTAAQRA